jgi:GNAT superfamily N-acetyltransferase
MTRMVRDPLIARVLQLGPGQVWGADVFCLPEYRNQGIGRHLMNFSDRFVASLGFKEVLSTIVIGNTPSLRATLGSGNQLLYYVSYVRVSFYERLRVSKDIPRYLVEGPASR